MKERARKAALAVALLGTSLLVTGGESKAGHNGCLAGDLGCARFYLSENPSMFREYGYYAGEVPNWPSAGNLRNDGLTGNVTAIRNRSHPGRFIVFGPSGCRSRAQDALAWVGTSLNNANRVSKSTANPAGCVIV